VDFHADDSSIFWHNFKKTELFYGLILRFSAIKIKLKNRRTGESQSGVVVIRWKQGISALKAKQYFDFGNLLNERQIVGNRFGNLLDSVKHGGVIAVEVMADFRQRLLGQKIPTQEHGELSRILARRAG